MEMPSCTQRSRNNGVVVSCVKFFRLHIRLDIQVTRDTKHYNLQMIIAVGFKVNSERAVQFCKWVNQIAKDYTIKGWVMDDERLKCGTYLTEKYFDEQLERIPCSFSPYPIQ